MTFPALFSLLLLASPPLPEALSAPATEHVVPEKLESIQRRVRDLARKLAKAGFSAEVDQTLACLEQTGATSKEMASFRNVIDRLLGEAKPPRRVERTVTRFDETARDIAGRLAKHAAEEGRPEIAAAALLLDWGNAQAHELVGHVVAPDGSWVPAESLGRQKRGEEIRRALQRARALDIYLEPMTPAHPMFVEAMAGGGSAWRHENLVVESYWPAEKLAEEYRAVLQAMAFSNWLVSGELVPAHKPGLVLHLPRSQFAQVERQASEQGLVDQGRKFAVGRVKFNLVHRQNSGGSLYESWASILTGGRDEVLASVFHLYDDALPGWGWPSWYQAESQNPLWAIAGHLNLASVACIGASLPDFRIPEENGWKPELEGAGPEFSLARAGLDGCRMWLRQRAREGAAPGLDITMMDGIEKILEMRLWKATSAVEMLHQEGRFVGLLQKYAELYAAGNKDGVVRRTERVLGQPIPRFEEAWQAWMLEGDAPVSLGNMLRARVDQLVDAADPVVSALNEVRDEIGLRTVVAHPALTRGVAEYAKWLAAQPAARDAWPDVELPETLQPAGARAGRNALLAEGDGQACVDAWLATFYHRVAVLHPGLHAVGAASGEGFSVVDAKSMVDRSGDWWVAYPSSEQKNVPLVHAPIPPHPVPEAAGDTLGYPVTFHAGPGVAAEDLTMRLEKFDGKEEVACYLSSPFEPTHPGLVPDNAWCLLPTQPLEPGMKYRVVVKSDAVDLSWTFETAEG